MSDDSRERSDELMTEDESEPSSSDESGESAPKNETGVLDSELGYKDYCNSEELSDITIRYGHHGERVFYGHKILLCSHSRWFRAALAGGFQEATSKEILLKDDDPDDLFTLLSLPYGTAKPTWRVKKYDLCKEILRWLKLFQIAEKYQCPMLERNANSVFKAALHAYLCDLSDKPHPEQHAEDFLHIITTVYELAVDRPQLEIMQTLLTNAKWMAQKSGSLGRRLIPLLLACIKEHAEFSQDLLGSYLEETSEDSKIGDLTIRYQVRCRSCKKKWMLPAEKYDDSSKGGHCWLCGRRADSWEEYHTRKGAKSKENA